MAKTKEKADNFQLTKAQTGIMLASLERLGLATNGSKAEKAKRLREHFATFPKGKLLECSECRGDSTADFDACPFCGETDADETPEAKAPEAKAPAKSKKRSEAVAKKASGSAEKEPAAPRTPSPKERAAGAQKPPAKGGKGNAAAKAAAKEEPTTTLVQTATPMTTSVTVADLDASVAEVQRLKLAVVRNYYELGRELRRLYESEMWQLRQDDGAPRYTNWKAFAQEELGLSYLQTYKLMDVAAAFSEEDVTAIGHSKLNLVLKVPEEYRGKLLDEAKGGASKRDLEERVAEINRKEKGETPEPTPKKDRVTVALVPGRRTHTLLKRRKGKEVPGPAKTLADGPWVEVELSNDVRATYRLTKSTKGDLALIVEYNRIK